MNENNNNLFVLLISTQIHNFYKGIDQEKSQLFIFKDSTCTLEFLKIFDFFVTRANQNSAQCPPYSKFKNDSYHMTFWGEKPIFYLRFSVNS